MELATYIRVLRHRLWMIVACPIAAAVAAGVVSFLLPPVYEAHTALLVWPSNLGPSDPNVAPLSPDQISRTYALLMTQPPLLRSVSQDLDLNIRAEDLASEITVTPQTGTTILDVTVRDSNPTHARDIANSLVDQLVAEVKDIQSRNATSSNPRISDVLYVVSPATLPDVPVAPRKALNVAIAFAAGLVLAVGLALLLDYLDQSIKGDEELIGRLGLVPLGHIAYVPLGKVKRSELVALDPKSPSSEAFKALRTSVLFATIDQELKAIVITSPELGEGKSRTAANLAIALAQAGYQTLLIDADFRRPSQHRLFGQVRNIGLSNLIIQNASESEAIRQIDTVPNLSLLASGPTPPNPSELLGSARMREVMSKLWHQFNYVIIDTPPVNAVTDAAIIAASANATIVVVEQGRTTFPALKHTRELLDRVNARTIGAVLNKVRPEAGSYSYGYGYYGPGPDTRA